MRIPFPRNDTKDKHARVRCRTRAYRSFEQLEERQLLRAAELSWADTSQLTLSFADEQTDIAGEPNQLFELFSSFARPADWQRTILNGFQTWIQYTGSNIGVVSEAKSLPFGTPGPRTGDRRFGDIRVGARPLSPDVMAIALARDTVVAGTWSGDVIFNSNAQFKNLEELFAVTVHEAGHVFGLEHGDDPLSPMYDQGIPKSVVPTAEDISGVQRLHGQRVADQNEGPLGNESPRTATPLELTLTPELDVTAAHLVYGDITTPDDVDVFSLSVPPRVKGPVKIRLQSRRISLLAPMLRVSTVDGVEVAKSESRRVGGATLEILIDDVVRGATYLIEVRAVRGTPFDVGGYSLVTTFEGEVPRPALDRTLSALTEARAREFTQREIQAMLAQKDRLLDARENRVDNILTAVSLPPDQGFELYSRYEAFGAITSVRDVDYYYFGAAETDRGRPYAHLTIRPLEPGGLIPDVRLLDSLGNDLRAEVLVNGSGEVVLQAPVAPGERYYVRVTAASKDGWFDRGNYRVSLTFVETPVQLSTFAQGRMPGDNNQPRKDEGFALYVAVPQLFHFVLQAGPKLVDRSEFVLASLFNEQGQLIQMMSAPSGETRTSNSLLLLPGIYTMRFDPIALDGRPTGRLGFRMRGLSISDPFAIDPYDPLFDPFFECPDSDELYCYPGGVESEDPFLWDDFLDSLPEIPELTLSELVFELLGSWWSWYWDEQGTNMPPLAVDDGYLVSSNTTLVVGSAEGVLANDVFGQTAQPSAILVKDVDEGVLNFEVDGSFTYIAPPGFSGDVEFQYQALDVQQSSPAATVTIRVMPGQSIPGDFDDNNLVDADDVNLLCEAIRFQIPDAIYDLNLDGFINGADWDTLLEVILRTTAGDANLDGQFNSADLVEVFSINEYEDGVTDNSTWSTGDWNCDGEFTSSDLIAAFQAGSYVAESAPVSAQSARFNEADLAATIAADRFEDDRRRRIRRMC